jgi:hypothetical protein
MLLNFQPYNNVPNIQFELVEMYINQIVTIIELHVP